MQVQWKRSYDRKKDIRVKSKKSKCTALDIMTWPQLSKKEKERILNLLAWIFVVQSWMLNFFNWKEAAISTSNTILTLSHVGRGGQKTNNSSLFKTLPRQKFHFPLGQMALQTNGPGFSWFILLHLHVWFIKNEENGYITSRIDLKHQTLRF